MTTYIITYDIEGGDKTRSDAIVKALNEIGAQRLQMSVWLFESNSTSDQVYDFFVSKINKENDKLFVCQLTGKARFSVAFNGGASFVNNRNGYFN